MGYFFFILACLAAICYSGTTEKLEKNTYDYISIAVKYTWLDGIE